MQNFSFIQIGCIIGILLQCLSLSAQERQDSLQFIPSDTIPLSSIDTLPQVGTEADSIIIAAKKSPILLPDSVLKQHSKRAAYWSFIPGAGHVYNKQYWKAPVYAGLFLGGVSTTLLVRSQYNTYNNAYKGRLNNRVLQSPTYRENGEIATLSDNELRLERRKFGRLYGLSLAGTALIYGANILDAYASAEIKRKNRLHSPLRAATRSALLPGWGQAYNRKYWKIPIIYGGLAFTGYLIYDHYTYRQIFKDQYLSLTREGYENPNFSKPHLKNRIERLSLDSPIYQDANNVLTSFEDRDRLLSIYILFTALIYAINIIDATIDAHLYNFDVSDDLSIRVEPNFAPDEFGRMGFRGVRWVVGF